MEEMGYRNMQLVWEAARNGRLGRESKGGLLTDDLAVNMLTYMSQHTYDWPPTDNMKWKKIPCRYYTLGDRCMIEDMGMALVPSLDSFDDPEVAEALMTKRYNSAVTRLKRARKFLTERGLVKQLEPPIITGKRRTNAGYLLLLGDASENAEVEAWARKCLGL